MFLTFLLARLQVGTQATPPLPAKVVSIVDRALPPAQAARALEVRAIESTIKTEAGVVLRNIRAEKHDVEP